MITALSFVVVAQIAIATPAPAPRLSGGFGAKPVTAAPAATRKAPVVLTVGGRSPRSGEGTFSVAGVAGTVEPTPTPTQAALGATGQLPAAISDEAAWRERAAKLRADLSAAQAELDVADRAHTVVSHGPLGRDYYLLMAIRNSALAPYRARVASIRIELDGLPEECRKTVGCQPGWLR